MDGLKTDLNQLIIFAKVVETRSFTAAGRALGLPKSTVSRKVAQLEDRLGVQLLERTTRRIALTDSGAAFHEHCLRITADIVEAEQAVGRDPRRPHGLLRIAAGRELGTRFLTATISAFLHDYPEVDIELELGGRSLDARGEGVDLTLRVDPRVESNLLVRELGPLRQRVVASRSYLADRGAPIDTLEGHAWVASREALPIGVRPRLLVDDLDVLRETLLAGVGVGLLPLHECVADLEAGRLVELPAHLQPALDESSIHAIFSVSRQLSTKVRCFVEFVRDRLAQPDVSESEVSESEESELSTGSALYSGHSAGIGDSATQP